MSRNIHFAQYDCEGGTCGNRVWKTTMSRNIGMGKKNSCAAGVSRTPDASLFRAALYR